MKNFILAVVLAATAAAASAQSQTVVVNEPQGSLQICMIVPSVGSMTRVVCQ